MKDVGRCPRGVAFSSLSHSKLWLILLKHSLTCTHRRGWKATVQKDVIQLEFQSPRMFPSFVLSEGDKRKQGKDEGQNERTEGMWLDSSLLNSRLTLFGEEEQNWRLTARPCITHQTGEESCRPKMGSVIDFSEEVISALQPRFPVDWEAEIWSHFLACWSKSGWSILTLWTLASVCFLLLREENLSLAYMVDSRFKIFFLSRA